MTTDDMAGAVFAEIYQGRDGRQPMLTRLDRYERVAHAMVWIAAIVLSTVIVTSIRDIRITRIDPAAMAETRK